MITDDDSLLTSLATAAARDAAEYNEGREVAAATFQSTVLRNARCSIGFAKIILRKSGVRLGLGRGDRGRGGAWKKMWDCRTFVTVRHGAFVIQLCINFMMKVSVMRPMVLEW